MKTLFKNASEIKILSDEQQVRDAVTSTLFLNKMHNDIIEVGIKLFIFQKKYEREWRTHERVNVCIHLKVNRMIIQMSCI